MQSQAVAYQGLLSQHAVSPSGRLCLNSTGACTLGLLNSRAMVLVTMVLGYSGGDAGDDMR